MAITTRPDVRRRLDTMIVDDSASVAFQEKPTRSQDLLEVCTRKEYEHRLAALKVYWAQWDLEHGVEKG